MIYVSRQEHFNAAHKLHNPKWSDERNREVFGPCANTNWHGHNYDLIVTVKGQPDPETGFVVDLKALSDLLRTHITEQVDHKNLNLDVPFPGRPDGQHREPGPRLLANHRARAARHHHGPAALRETLRNAAQLRGILRRLEVLNVEG